MSDNIAIGLDMSSFSQDKEAALQRFINLFNTLEQYDGKVYSPVMGGGLVEFNNSIKQTGNLLSELSAKMETLNTTSGSLSGNIKSTSGSATELGLATKAYAKDADDAARASAKLSAMTSEQSKQTFSLKVQLEEARKALLNEARAQNQSYQARVAQINLMRAERSEIAAVNKATEAAAAEKMAALKAEHAQRAALINQQAAEQMRASAMIINQSSAGIENVGKGLRNVFSYMRTIAYILPGLGIAGIFNLAFQAIGAAGEALFAFMRTTEKVIEVQILLNKQLSEQISLLDRINESYRKMNEVKNSDIVNSERQLELLKAYKDNQDKITQSELKLAELRFKKAGEKVNDKGGEQAILAEMSYLQKQWESAQGRLINLNAALKNQSEGKKGSGYADPVMKTWVTDEDDLKKLKDALEGEVATTKTQFDNLNEVYSKFYSTQQDLGKRQKERDKFLRDERRKITIETEKEDLSTKIDANEKAFSKEISSEQTKLNSLRNIRDERKRLNQLDYDNIATNNTSNPSDIIVAANKLKDENIKVDADYYEKRGKLIEEYRQRFLKATTEINKDDVDEQAIASERIYKNEEKNLNDRLVAYNDYLTKKQTLQNLEYAMAIDKLSLKADDPTARKELEQIDSARDRMNANIQADAEHMAYEITFSSLQKQLKAVIDENGLEKKDNNIKYAEELEALNKKLEQHKIRYNKFKKEQKAIDEKYRIEGAKNDMADDTMALARLRNTLKDQEELLEETKKNVKNSAENLEVQKLHGDSDEKVLEAERELNIERGKQKALENIIVEGKKAIKVREDDYNKKRAAAAHMTIDQLLEAERLYKDERTKLVEAMIELLKTAIDAEYQKRIKAIEDETKIRDEQYDSEIDAVEKSSLTLKDKQALEIQLKQEKLEFDKQQQIEEKRLKQEQAVYDKALAMAHVLWATEEAIMNALALPLPPPVPETIAIERGALGAIHLATIALQDVPSYAEGTPDEGHKGGVARFGEDGVELVKEPYKSPYFVTKETISYLPQGTHVIPFDDIPTFDEKSTDYSWEQTRFLAKEIKKISKSPVVNNNIVINLGFENYKHSKLYGE